VDGLGAEHAAFQREHHAAAEDGIEKGERIAEEQESGARSGASGGCIRW